MTEVLQYFETLEKFLFWPKMMNVLIVTCGAITIYLNYITFSNLSSAF